MQAFDFSKKIIVSAFLLICAVVPADTAEAAGCAVQAWGSGKSASSITSMRCSTGLSFSSLDS